jgi:hypothetical protein
MKLVAAKIEPRDSRGLRSCRYDDSGTSKIRQKIPNKREHHARKGQRCPGRLGLTKKYRTVQKQGHREGNHPQRSPRDQAQSILPLEAKPAKNTPSTNAQHNTNQHGYFFLFPSSATFIGKGIDIDLRQAAKAQKNESPTPREREPPYDITIPGSLTVAPTMLTGNRNWGLAAASGRIKN